MTTKDLVNQILDQAREDRNLPTDTALARALGVTNNAIWRWRNGKVHQKTFTLVKLLAEQTQHDAPVDSPA